VKVECKEQDAKREGMGSGWCAPWGGEYVRGGETRRHSAGRGHGGGSSWGGGGGAWAGGGRGARGGGGAWGGGGGEGRGGGGAGKGGRGAAAERGCSGACARWGVQTGRKRPCERRSGVVARGAEVRSGGGGGWGGGGRGGLWGKGGPWGRGRTACRCPGVGGVGGRVYQARVAGVAVRVSGGGRAVERGTRRGMVAGALAGWRCGLMLGARRAGGGGRVGRGGVRRGEGSGGAGKSSAGGGARSRRVVRKGSVRGERDRVVEFGKSRREGGAAEMAWWRTSDAGIRSRKYAHRSPMITAWPRRGGPACTEESRAVTG